MTPEQLEKLRRIDAHLANLLSTAEKRTPGEWHVATDAHYAPGTLCVVGRPDHGQVGHVGNCIARVAPPECTTFVDHANAAFIASCAGNAEAGWKATRAAIATALNCESWDYTIKEMYVRQDAEAILESILAAFPNV